MNAARALGLIALLLAACTASHPQPKAELVEPKPAPSASIGPIPIATIAPPAAKASVHEPLLRQFESLARKPGTAVELDAFIKDHPELLTAEADPYGSALFWVLEFEQEEAVLALIRAGMQIPKGALTLTARGGLDDIGTILIEKGADPNETDEWGETPLHLAAKHGHVSMMRKLLKAKALPNAKDKNDGFTALHFAVMGRHVDAIKVLIEAKANLEVKDNQGRTALHWGPFAYIRQAKHIYEKIGEPHNTVFVDPGPAIGMQLLIEAGAKINTTDDEGDTPLHEAARLNSIRGVEILLAKGAKRNIKNKAGDTPLSIAKSREHLAEIAKMLEGK